MKSAWHLPSDHGENYWPGISLTLGDLLRQDPGRRRLGLNRPLHNRQEGGLRSKIKGRGMDYAESRIYQAGDEVRHIDWRLTARRDSLHTKVFHVERERPALLVLDQCRTMYFGSRDALKSVTAARLCARALWQRLQLKDRVGLIRYDDAGVDVLRPSTHREDALKLLNRIVVSHQRQLERVRETTSVTDTTAPSTLYKALNETRALLTPGTLVYWFADLMSLQESSFKQLSDIARRAELRIYALHDPLESQLPGDGIYSIVDGDVRVTVNTQSTQIRRQYQQSFEQQKQQLHDFCQRRNIKWLALAGNDGLAHGFD